MRSIHVDIIRGGTGAPCPGRRVGYQASCEGIGNADAYACMDSCINAYVCIHVLVQAGKLKLQPVRCRA